MSIQDIVLHDALTTSPVFGGNAYQFGPTGQLIANGIQLVDTGEADYFSRFQLTLKNRPTSINMKTGALSAEKRTVVLSLPVIPEILGVPQGVHFDSARLEITTNPSTGSTESMTKFRKMLSDFLLSSAADPYFAQGSMA